MRLTGFTLLLIAALFLGVCRAHAQIQPPKSVISGRITESVRAVHSADLDGDGDEDILTASFNDGKIAWYENEGSGVFSKQRIITKNADGAAAVHAADLDDDGDLDVISGSYEDLQGNGEGKLAWYENTGDGTFSSQKVIEDFFDYDGVWSVQAADIDEDGDKDVVFTAADDFFWPPDDGKIAWYENTGDGSFSSDQQVIASDVGAASLDLADADGDSDTDIVSRSTGGGIARYINSNGSFTEVALNNSDGAISVHFTDMDGDGDEDILSASPEKIVWYEKIASGYSNQKNITDEVSEIKSVYPADLDGDNDMDVISADSDANKISAYENQNGSSFGELVITTEAAGARSVHAADLDGGGDPDVVSASPDDDKTAWYENRIEEGEEFSDPRVLSSSQKSLSNLSSVHAADLDGDGNKDIISSSYVDFDGEGNDKIAWYRNEGNGLFSRQKIIATESNGARSIYAADLDGDGDKDILSGSFEYFDGRGDDKIVWYENIGGVVFSSENVIMADAGGVVSVYASDLDGDTDQDVLIAAENEGKIAWFENTEGGGFSNQKVIVTSTDEDGNAAIGAQSVYSADLDGDGDQDVLSASQGDNKIAWYENIDGEGVFSEQKVITTDADGAESVYAGDVDGDGDTDVFAASSSLNGDNKITWYENDGNGSFSDQKQVATGLEGAQSVHGADVDRDGSVDILSTYASGLVWHKKSSSFGSISFSNETIDSQGGPEVTSSDLDGDGDPDVVAGLDNDTVVWYENVEGALPVELNGFDAALEGGSAVLLTWTTASETGNAEFRIQRCTGEEAKECEGAWTTVGAAEGSGTTSQAQSYRFTDADLPYEADRLTYRLKQMDTDGSASFSKEVTVERSVKEAQLLETYPNPAQRQATVRYALPERQDVKIYLYDVLGRRVRTVVDGEREGRHKRELDVSRLTSGVYFLRLQSDGQTRTQKLTVVR